ncbi:MAG: DUF1566 domain-containing protein [Spirochaetes bacterium]|nr:DUF1566 domain-containing protein [Spirochaetota bacterium]
MKKKFKLALGFLTCLCVAPLLGAPFTDNLDGTVTDARNNLRWQKCSNGQTYSGGTCTGVVTTATWATALKYCQTLSLASKAWRLPSRNEFLSIVDRSVFNPAISAAYFPITPASRFWSSTTSAPYTTGAWYVDFNDGSSSLDGKFYKYAVRCVATGP